MKRKVPTARPLSTLLLRLLLAVCVVLIVWTRGSAPRSKQRRNRGRLAGNVQA
jgi:hypothetical protein